MRLAHVLIGALVVAVAASILSPSTARAAGGERDLSFGVLGTALVDATRPSLDVASAVIADFQLPITTVAGAVGGRMAVARFYDDNGGPAWLEPDAVRTVDFGVDSAAHGVAENIDGVIAVGQAGPDMAMAEFDRNGRPVTSFGQSGHLVVHDGDGSVAEAVSGDIVVGSVMRSGQRDTLIAKVNSFGLDPTFNGSGSEAVDVVPGDDDAGLALLVDSANRLYVAGQAGQSAFVARFDLTSGTIDSSFGTGGKALLDLTPGPDVARAITVDPGTGDLLVAGQAGAHAFVARMSPDGVPTAGFGGGVVQFDLGGSADVATGAVWQPGLGVVVTGTRTTLLGSDAAARRITPSGLVDPTFGLAGLSVADFGSAVDRSNAVAAARDGRFVVAGNNASDMVVARFTSDGEVDPSFGIGGRVVLDGNGGDLAGPVRVTPDGRVVVVGSSGGQLLVARRLRDGQPDVSFGVGGMVLDEFGDALPIDAVVQPDNRILVLVYVSDRSWGSIGRLVRYLPDGSRDPSFGEDGIGGFVVNPGLQSSLLVLADGRILVSGAAYNTAGTGVTRFLPSGVPDPSFGSGGFVAATQVDSGGALGVQSDGTILLALAQPFGKVAVVRISAGGTVLSVAGAYADVGGPPVVSVLPDDRFYVTGVMGVRDSLGRAQEDAVTVARFGRDGYLDSGSLFGTSGMVHFNLGANEVVTDVALDGSYLLVVGSAYSGRDVAAQQATRVLRMDESGKLDARYGSNGIATVVGGSLGATRAPGGSPLVAGTVSGNGTTDIAVTRLQPGPPADAPTTTPTTAPTPAPATPPRRSGYWMVTNAGTTYGFGDARHLGDAATTTAADVEATPSARGYWIVDAPGQVFAFGDARYLGAPNGAGLARGESVTSISSTPSGAGYWLFTSRGRVMPYGDAPFLGDMAAAKLAEPVVDSVATPSGHGYYMVASDGGVFAFSDARFRGSMGGRRLNAPVESLVPDADGNGYWLVASDGGVFAFDAPFYGSMGGRRLNRPVAGMVRYGIGYLMVGEDGGIFNFSDRAFSGSLGDSPPAAPVVAVTAFDQP